MRSMFKIFLAVATVGVFVVALVVLTNDESKIAVDNNAVIETSEVVVEKTGKVTDDKDSTDASVVDNVKTGDTKVLKAQFKKIGDTWSVSVTLKHPDTGWKHYADFWQLVDENGVMVAKRVLVHPHVDEQPFTRSMGDIEIRKNQKIIFVEAGDSVHGMSRNRLTVDFSKNTGNEFTVGD